MLEVLWNTPVWPMRGRWELTDEQWDMVEPVLRPARRADNRGRPWHDTRAVLNGVLWVLGDDLAGCRVHRLDEPYLGRLLTGDCHVEPSSVGALADWGPDGFGPSVAVAESRGIGAVARQECKV